MDFPAPVAEDLMMLYSDKIKFSILGISVALLLLAFGILAWQIFRCCTLDSHTDKKMNNDVVYSDDERPGTSGISSGTPSTRVKDLNTEVQRLSRCLTQVLPPPSGSSQTDEDLGEQTAIKKVDGKLRFSIYYDQLQSRLVVTILQVEGLQEPGQKLHPFVKISLMWACSHELELKSCITEGDRGIEPVMWTMLQDWRTRIVKGSCNPLYGDQFSCFLQEDKKLNHIILRMEVRDFDKFSRHTVLGEVKVPLGQLNISYPLELQEDLQIP